MGSEQFFGWSETRKYETHASCHCHTSAWSVYFCVWAARMSSSSCFTRQTKYSIFMYIYMSKVMCKRNEKHQWEQSAEAHTHNHSIARHHDIARDIKNQTDRPSKPSSKRRPPALHSMVNDTTLLPHIQIIVHMLHINENERTRTVWRESTSVSDGERTERIRKRSMMRGKQMGKIVNRLLIHIINYIKNKNLRRNMFGARNEPNNFTYFVRQQQLKSTEKSEKKKVLRPERKMKQQKKNRNNFDERIHMALSEYDSRFHVVRPSLRMFAVQRVYSRSSIFRSVSVFVSKILFHFSWLALSIEQICWCFFFCFRSFSFSVFFSPTSCSCLAMDVEVRPKWRALTRTCHVCQPAMGVTG